MDVVITGIRDFIFSFKAYLTVPAFIRDNRLWSGFEKNALVLLGVCLLGLILGLSFIRTILQWWSDLSIHSVSDVGIEAASLVGDIASTGYNTFFNGAYKYIILILMELLIFHMAIRTNEILTGTKEELTPKIFVQAQIRMLKVSIFAYVMELIATIILGVILGIAGLKFLDTPLSFIIECYFLGFLLIDNYNEINKMGIRDSYKHTLHYPGASIAIGFVLYILLLIPLIGPVVAPMTGAIAATLIMHQLSKRNDGDPLTQPTYHFRRSE